MCNGISSWLKILRALQLQANVTVLREFPYLWTLLSLSQHTNSNIFLSMKSIALLTMVILPGTFTSTLFAIPLFNWDAESWRDVPKSRFWFYWALTIPLTILTVAMWLIWQKAFERTGRSLDKAAREQVPNSRIPHGQTSGASSSSGERDEIEQHNISDGPRMRKKGRLDGWLPWHKRSNRDTGTNQGESLV